MADDLDYRIAKLEVRPGDLLVMKCKGCIDNETARRIKGQFTGLLPDRAKVIVIDDQTDLSVLAFD